MITKSEALAILKSIYKDIYGRWQIPHYYQYCNKEVNLSNGEKATIAMDDKVYDWLEYVKKLIENEEN